MSCCRSFRVIDAIDYFTLLVWQPGSGLCNERDELGLTAQPGLPEDRIELGARGRARYAELGGGFVDGGSVDQSRCKICLGRRVSIWFFPARRGSPSAT